MVRVTKASDVGTGDLVRLYGTLGEPYAVVGSRQSYHGTYFKLRSLEFGNVTECYYEGIRYIVSKAAQA